MPSASRLSLGEAVKAGRLSDFVKQEEDRGVGPACPRQLERALTVIIKAPRSKGQTSRSSSAAGSTGKRTR